jgi:hypothetical protein
MTFLRMVAVKWVGAGALWLETALKVIGSLNQSLWPVALCSTESNHKQIRKGPHVAAVVSQVGVISHFLSQHSSLKALSMLMNKSKENA